MGFEELAGDDLVAWMAGWVGKVAGSVQVQRPPAARVGTVTVSVRGELQRLDLSPAAAGMEPAALGRAIEQAYAAAYVEALRQLDMVFARVSEDIAGDPELARRVQAMRMEYADLSGLKKMIRPPAPKVERHQGEDEWDPAQDPLRRQRRR